VLQDLISALSTAKCVYTVRPEFVIELSTET